MLPVRRRSEARAGRLWRELVAFVRPLPVPSVNHARELGGRGDRREGDERGLTRHDTREAGAGCALSRMRYARIGWRLVHTRHRVCVHLRISESLWRSQSRLGCAARGG
jgi:hypothetical protein